jgi:hypothetical protein
MLVAILLLRLSGGGGGGGGGGSSSSRLGVFFRLQTPFNSLTSAKLAT